MEAEGRSDRSRTIDVGLTFALVIIIIALAILGAFGAVPHRSVARTMVPWGLGLAVLTYVALLAAGYRSIGLYYLVTFLQVLIASIIGVLLIVSLARLIPG
jgi:hypothetical protein